MTMPIIVSICGSLIWSLGHGHVSEGSFAVQSGFSWSQGTKHFLRIASLWLSLMNSKKCNMKGLGPTYSKAYTHRQAFQGVIWMETISGIYSAFTSVQNNVLHAIIIKGLSHCHCGWNCFGRQQSYYSSGTKLIMEFVLILAIVYIAFSMSCCPPTWLSDGADWPGYPGQSLWRSDKFLLTLSVCHFWHASLYNVHTTMFPHVAKDMNKSQMKHHFAG